MNRPLAKCIYCNAHVDTSKGVGDHVIPAALGEFKGATNFRGICNKCNHKLGRIEEELIRSSPAAYYTRVSLPPGRRSRESANWIPAKTSPSPSFYTPQHGVDLELKHHSHSVRSIQPQDQIVMKGRETGVVRRVFIHRKMGLDAIKRKVLENKPQEKFDAHINIADNDNSRLESIAEYIWPGEKIFEQPPIERGFHAILVRIDFCVTENYFRAILGIALHYYLCHNNRRLTGHENCFEAVKSAILGTGDAESRVSITALPVHRCAITPQTIVSNEQLSIAYWGNFYSGEWCHSLTLDDTSGHVIVYVTLFCGDYRLDIPHTHMCRIAKLDRPTSNGTICATHYTWKPRQKTKGRMYRRIWTPSDYQWKITLPYTTK